MPLDTLQVYLDRIGKAVMDDDWGSYRAGVDLPFMLISADANIVVSDEDRLRQSFDGFVATLRHQRISHYIRLAISAEHVTPNLISGRYETEMLSRGKRVLPCYPSRIVVRCTGDAWRAASIITSLTNLEHPMLVPAVQPATDPERTDR